LLYCDLNCKTSKIYIENIVKTDEINILKYFKDLNINNELIYSFMDIKKVLRVFVFFILILMIGDIIYKVFFNYSIDVSITQILDNILGFSFIISLLLTNILIMSFFEYISCINEYIKSNFENSTKRSQKC